MGSEHWSNVAGAWEDSRTRAGGAGGDRAEEWLLEHAALEPGVHLLELACGTGKAGVAAAGRLMPGGRALLSDFAESMVDAARRRAEAAGQGAVEFAVLDAHDTGLPDASFDAVMCGFGLMLMSDPVRAAREARRVLRPDGRMVLAVWAEQDANPWLGFAFRAVMDELGAPEPEAGTPGPFALGSAERLEEVLREAGFTDVGIERIELSEPHDSVDSWWSAVETSAGPLVALLQALPEQTRGAIRGRAVESVRRFEADAGGLVFPAAFNAALARP